MSERLSVDDLIDGIWEDKPKEPKATGVPPARAPQPKATVPPPRAPQPKVTVPPPREEVLDRVRVPEPEPLAPTPEEPKSRTDRRRLRRKIRQQVRLLALIAIVVGVVAAAAVASLRTLAPGSLDGEEQITLGAPAQETFVWTIWRDDPPGPAYVAVVGTGGEDGAVLVGVPDYTVASIPGQGVGTVGDAARLGDPKLVATTVANILGIGIDGSVGTTLEELGELVDGLGGITVGKRIMTGQDVVTYLGEGRHEDVGELEFLRGQEVFLGLLQTDGGAEAFSGLAEDLARIFAGAGESEITLLELPVDGIGAGLARPDEEAVSKLSGTWFLPTATSGRGVRLVILNGKGTPGIGEDVANILVPSGFRLVSSQNAMSFNVRNTQIVASTEEFLDEARLARELLGVGRVYLGDQPTGVADVSIIVGRDFPPE